MWVSLISFPGSRSRKTDHESWATPSRRTEFIHLLIREGKYRNQNYWDAHPYSAVLGRVLGQHLNPFHRTERLQGPVPLLQIVEAWGTAHPLAWMIRVQHGPARLWEEGQSSTHLPQITPNRPRRQAPPPRPCSIQSMGADAPGRP